MEDAVTSVVERELGTEPVRATRVAEGLQHDTWRVACGGEEYVVQFAATGDDADRDSLRRGVHWYVALRDTPVPVPAVVTDTPGTYDGRRYAIVEAVAGDTGERDISPARTRNAARALAAIHDARSFDAAGWLEVRDGTASVYPFEAGGFRAWLRANAAETTATLREAGLGGVADGLTTLFDRFGDRVSATGAYVLCHDDCSPDNVVFDGDAVAAVIDFDRSYAGAGQRDLAKAANAFWMHDPTAEWGVRETFYEAYDRERGVGPGFDRREPLYRVESLADTVAGMHRIGELSTRERSFYAERLRDAIDRADALLPER